MLTHSWIPYSLALAVFGICAAATHVRAAGVETILKADFGKPDSLNGWEGAGALAPGREGRTALLLENANAKSGVMRTIALPAEKLVGQLLTCRVTLKAEGVTQPPKSWNGIKAMLVLETASGKDYPQIALSYGSFDWQTQSRILRMPDDLRKATLVLGLEQVAGKVWFESVEVLTGRGPAKKPETLYRGHSLERLRGVMYGPHYSEKGIRDLADWGCNLLRWQLTWNGFPHSPADNASPEEYDKWLNERLDDVDKGLALCAQLGMLVLIDIHTPPGGRDEQKFCRMFSEKRHQEHFLIIWDRIAKRYKDNKTVWGYDLVNEPFVGKVGDGCMNWQALAEATAKRVRAIDPDHAIILEPIWGDPHALDSLIPVDVPNVVYSVHMYLPHAFTHQGVYESPIGPTYPGEVQGKKWDKETLRASLKNVVEYARDYGVHIYVGEFSAIRWAPDNSAQRYLKDCIEFFEEMGWDWSYHAFREWDGWSVEHTTNKDDKKPSATRTDREQLMRDWFGKNQHPK
jgi:aryl-phospho-beta-D-glucosidase BglC (GH1 family)